MSFTRSISSQSKIFEVKETDILNNMLSVFTKMYCWLVVCTIPEYGLYVIENKGSGGEYMVRFIYVKQIYVFLCTQLSPHRVTQSHGNQSILRTSRRHFIKPRPSCSSQYPYPQISDCMHDILALCTSAFPGSIMGTILHSTDYSCLLTWVRKWHLIRGLNYFLMDIRCRRTGVLDGRTLKAYIG